jgi:uncharacterized membrane protein YecN with MAPEG domain
MSLTITPVYAALLALLFIALSMRVIRMRREERVALGDGGNARVLRAMGVHANFAEYVPLALILIMFVEAGGMPGWLIHLLGSVLLAGRLVHAYGVSQSEENYNYRVAGMILTFSAIALASLINIGVILIRE